MMNCPRKLLFFAAATCGLALLPALCLAESPRLVRTLPATANADRGIVLFVADENLAEDETEKDHGRWLGVQIRELPSALRKQLRLDRGVLAVEVLADSPAAEGGIEEDDVLLAIDGQDVREPLAVRQAVDAADVDAQLNITLLRSGKEVTVNVKPGQRPADHLARLRGPATDSGADSEQQAFLLRQHQAMQALQQALGDRQALGMMFMRPGVIAAGQPLELPKDVTVNITRRGKQAAEILVERGDKTWNVTEKSLDKLPADVQGPVAAMLHGGAMAFTGEAVSVRPDGRVQGEIRVAPGAGDPIDPPPRVGPVEPKLDQILKELQDLHRRIDKLQQQAERE